MTLPVDRACSKTLITWGRGALNSFSSQSYAHFTVGPAASLAGSWAGQNWAKLKMAISRARRGVTGTSDPLINPGPPTFCGFRTSDTRNSSPSPSYGRFKGPGQAPSQPGLASCPAQKIDQKCEKMVKIFLFKNTFYDVPRWF